MKIPMETTIDNLKKLSESRYEHVSFLISELANDANNESRDATEEEVMASYNRINAEYSETFKALAQ